MMKVYAESNFILELAFLQEQYPSCQKILSLCETGQANLVIPSFCISEPYDVLVRKSKARDVLRQKLEIELQQLSRNATLPKKRIETLEEVIELLLQTGKEEKQRLQHTLKRILNVCELIPMVPEVLTLAAQVEEPLELSLQDSMVYASVVHHLSTSDENPKCFLNRNSKDFNQSDIQTTLENHHCKLFFHFELGYNYIRSQAR
jgi:predicted nucleic acid-binding protein